jgi:hypothetical protein
MCAYGSEGITAAGAAGATDGCKHHANGPSGYTQDGDALDFDLHSGDSVRSVDAGIVRWAKAYTGSSSWSCYGNSIAIDEHQADGSVVTAFYAHLLSIKVAVGDAVTQGEEIGKAGGTGGGTNSACPSAYGPHLHLALYTNASYTDAKGSAVAAADLPATATGSREPVTSPPYGGTARLPEPWLNCSRHSALASPPSGEDASCASLHAGDVLTVGAGQVPSSPSRSAAALGPAGFSATGSMAVGGGDGPATLLTDGRVLLVGVPAELYDPATGKFSPTGSMSTGRWSSAATLLKDGRVLVTGEEDGTGKALTSAELYDPKAGTFSPTGSLPSGCELCTATLLADGRVLVIGRIPSGPGQLVEVYDPQSGAFSPTGPMASDHSNERTATLLSDGRVLVTGGASDVETSTSAELFDPRTGTFSPTGPMTTSRLQHAAIRLANGRVLLVGGQDFQNKLLSSAELYNPSDGSFTATGSMSTIRNYGQVTLLADGRVLVTGGEDGTGKALTSAEIYDPKTGVFTPTSSMTTARFGHSATLLADGRVLVAGGTADGKTVLASAELFQP